MVKYRLLARAALLMALALAAAAVPAARAAARAVPAGASRGQDIRALLRAARAGDLGAEARLGERYATGRGVPRNPVLAYVWLGRAVVAAQGTEAAGIEDERARLAIAMSPKELARALALDAEGPHYRRADRDRGHGGAAPAALAAN